MIWGVASIAVGKPNSASFASAALFPEPPIAKRTSGFG
jgi:hypothetical protein